MQGNFTPKPQWVPADPPDDPFLRPAYIDRELPAETITELKFLAPRAPADEPVPQESDIGPKSEPAIALLKDMFTGTMVDRPERPSRIPRSGSKYQADASSAEIDKKERVSPTQLLRCVGRKK